MDAELLETAEAPQSDGSIALSPPPGSLDEPMDDEASVSAALPASLLDAVRAALAGHDAAHRNAGGGREESGPVAGRDSNEAGQRRWLEMDLGECTIELNGRGGEKKLLALRSLEVALEFR